MDGIYGGIKPMPDNNVVPISDYKEYYNKQLEIGQVFQDFITKELYKHGIILVNYGSKKYQLEEGENILGAEIKRDDNFNITGNLFVEFAEKTNPNNSSYVRSGINRDDNSWLYIIGDEKTIWIFGKSILKGILTTRKAMKESNNKKHGLVENSTKTAWGMLMTIAHANKYCNKRIDIK